MINFHDVVKEVTQEHNLNWPEVLDHPNKMLIAGDSSQPPDIDRFIYVLKIYKKQNINC